MELEIFNPALERHDPAVEKRFRRHDLAAEVVDHEGPAQCLDVEGRLVELGNRIEAQIEHIKGQLAAGDDEGPLAGDPTAVEIFAPDAARLGGACRLLIGALVNAGIEDLDDLPFHLEAIGDVDHIVEDAADLFGDRSLAVAGRAIEEDRAAGIDGRTKLVDECLRYHHVGEGGVERGAVDPLIGDPLAVDALGIGGERNRRGTHILVLAEGVLGPLLALFGQGVAQLRHGKIAGGAQDVEELAFLSLLDNELDDARRQLDDLADHRRCFGPSRIDGLDCEIEEILNGKPGVGERAGAWRRLMHHAFKVFGLELSERDQVLSQPAAGRLLAFECRHDVGMGHEAVGNEDVTDEHENAPGGVSCRMNLSSWKFTARCRSLIDASQSMLFLLLQPTVTRLG
jgi:hypothetical protein